MKKKTMKAIKDLNAYIDDDRQKICDRLHDMELSHKRLERLLRRWLWLSRHDVEIAEYESLHVVYGELIRQTRQELSYPYFRANYKVKGGKKCV